jgi:hypothetical protein
LRERAGAPLPSGERGDVDRITGAIRAAVGAEAFTAAFERGRVHGESEVDVPAR